MSEINITQILEHWCGLQNVPDDVRTAAYSVVLGLLKYGIPSCEVHEGNTGYYFDLVYHPFKGNSSCVMIRFPSPGTGHMRIQDEAGGFSFYTWKDVVKGFESYT